MNIVEFTDSIDPDEVTHNEPPHQDLHCLPSGLDLTFFEKLQAQILSSAFLTSKDLTY